MKKIMIGTIAAAGAALIAASAMAGEGKGPGGHRDPGRGFDRMDVNGDGKLTADEMSEMHAKLIEDADADGDGAVTRDEMKAFHDAKRAEFREKHNPDANGDGVVDRTEYIDAAQKRFDKKDKNGDGVLSEDEMDRHHHGGRRHGGGKN